MAEPVQASERWEDWVLRQQTDPKSCTGQLMAAGVSLETALVITMLGKVHEQLVGIAEALGQGADGEEWRE
jgi:hypothetical protein